MRARGTQHQQAARYAYHCPRRLPCPPMHPVKRFLALAFAAAFACVVWAAARTALHHIDDFSVAAISARLAVFDLFPVALLTTVLSMLLPAYVVGVSALIGLRDNDRERRWLLDLRSGPVIMYAAAFGVALVVGMVVDQDGELPERMLPSSAYAEILLGIAIAQAVVNGWHMYLLAKLIPADSTS